MAADALLGATVEVLVEKTINLASDSIALFVGFKNDLEKLQKMLTLNQAFLHDAEENQVTKESVKRWLEELERVAFDAENLLDDFNYEMIRRRVAIQNQMKRKVCFFFSLSNPVAFRCRMAKKIQKINMDLKSINERAPKLGLLQSQNGARDAPALSPPSGGGFVENRETDSLTVDASFIGRDKKVSKIVEDLTATSNNETISVLPIVGMGGIGKTTVARKVFNHPNIENHFEKLRMWVCVSDIGKQFDADKVFGLMLEKLGVPKPEVAGMDSREAKVQKLKELLKKLGVPKPEVAGMDSRELLAGGERTGQKPLKYLLVLDDVWNMDPTPWDGFLDSLRGISSAKGSWILVTTRNNQVAASTAISSRPFSLEQLSDDNCWLILEKMAFGARGAPDDLKELGSELAKKCQGLPLAAVVLGGMLRNKGRDIWHSISGTGFQNIGGDGDSYINKILRLSFDHIPYPSLKKCFAYCSIFPQDFEMKRNQLIQLWAAEGFLHSNPRNNMCMEEVGNMYFTILLDCNLFQDPQKDDYGNVLSCKMHDRVHDMVQLISKSKTLRLKESGSIDMEMFSIRYLALERSGKDFPSTKSFKCITTLFLQENRSLNDREISFFMLRVLTLRSSSVQELPKSIGKLTHLRYLDSSGTSIKSLPDSLCQLYNLQTLRVRDCESLKKFPNNFKNLVNLRHLDFFSGDKSSDIMPLEMGQLHFLQTLPFFNVCEERGRQIAELGSLDNLGGQLEIRNLELVKSKEEASSANLIGKQNIYELRLLWNASDNQRENDSEYNQVLEGLLPHQNLKGLIIEGFFGDQLPIWIGKLGKLVKFKLRNCKNCKELPTLGNMPFLKSLYLEGLDGVTSVGPSFYGGSGMHSGSSSQKPLKLFPALEHLILRDMQNLREWIEAAHDGTVVVFPIIETMEIDDCPQLGTFPRHVPHLKDLSISNIQNGSVVMGYLSSGVTTLTSLSLWNLNGLTQLPNVLFQNNPNLAKLSLYGCSHLTQFLALSHDVPQTSQHLVGLESLQELDIEECHSLESISIPRRHKYLTALQKLTIDYCVRLTQLSIPQISESRWDSTSSPFSSTSFGTCPPLLPLELLQVSSCHDLISFPINLTAAPSLSYLEISKCEKLMDLPEGRLCSLTSLRCLHLGPFSETTTELQLEMLFDALQPPPHPYFLSLSVLSLYGWPHWESLPDQLQHLSALSYLELWDFGVKSLPNWFGKLSSLQTLRLSNCKKLENLPSHQSIRSLTELYIDGCPLLKERCKPESSTDRNSEWSKISHIPKIKIDGEQIRDLSE